MKVQDQRGVSLLELMVAIGLIGVVGLAFAFLYFSSQRFLIQSSNYTLSQGEASFALEHIKRRVLQATAIANPAPGGILDLTGGGSFNFTWQRRIPAGTGPLQTLNSAYRLSGNNLFFDEDQNVPSTSPLARGMIGVTITRTGRTIVAVTLTSRRNTGDDINRDTQLQTIVTPRGLL